MNQSKINLHRIIQNQCKQHHPKPMQTASTQYQCIQHCPNTKAHSIHLNSMLIATFPFGWILWSENFHNSQFASDLSFCAQNDRSEANCELWKFSDQRIHPKGNVAMSIEFRWMLCALVLGQCCMHWYWVDAVCIGFGWCCLHWFWMILCKLIFDWFMSLMKNQGSSFCTVCSCTL